MLPAIICGGQGTRLWPVSRATYPKPFCDLLDQTLIEKTIFRLRDIGEPWLVTSNDLRGLTFRLYRQLHLDTNKILFEPLARNTAPAIALLCVALKNRNHLDEIVGVFPADHLVSNEAQFLEALKLAEDCANAGQIATVGIKPNYPATGFGYIEVKDQVFKSAKNLKAYQVAAFHEKPIASVAQDYLQQGKFFWNAGIFVFKVSTMIDALSRFMPELWDSMSQLKDDFSNLPDVYNKLESKSIDYGVMEKLESQVCIPSDIGWSDVGSWDEVAKLGDLASHGQKFGDARDRNWFYSMDPKKVVGFIDTEDVLVVDTPDALLISKMGSSQKVGNLTKELASKNAQITREHAFDFRPWGSYSNLREEDGYKVKVIQVDPGQQFSYQSHNKRSEHWVIVKGEAIVILEGKDHRLKTGDYIFIPRGAKHRMKNEGKVPVEFVEVQAGPYLGEDDIIRYEDDYGR
jgi:mannose-1-phosphate guanylyltransferase/mannose-6-phosphate isomerase